MSILIDELKANQDKYVLVVDVIKMMVDATSSKPDEVVKYLRAHKIDEKMMSFYMNEFYDFEPLNDWYFGNDANTTYLQKYDLESFEPITKHGLFKDKTLPNNLIHDVYGRTYDVNQHKKNREDEYLTLSETIEFLSRNTDINTSSYDHVKLRDIARRKLITPCFYYDGYVGSFRGDSDSSLYTEIVTGYFTYRLLTEEICRYDDYMKLPNDGVKIYSILEKRTAEYLDCDDVFLFYDKPQNLNDAEKLKLTHMEADEIRFSKSDLTNYINSIQPNNDNDDYFIEHVKLVNDDKLKQLDILKTENDDLNSRLSLARNTYKQHQKEIKALKEENEKLEAEKVELIKQLEEQTNTPADDSILQTILDQTHEYHAPDLSHAIKLWSDLYINGKIGTDSHSNKASLWISSNTGYTDNDKSSIGRIREVATPFKDFGTKRSRENGK